MQKKKDKRESAQKRQEEYENLSIDKKIKRAKSRGGSIKELAKLEKLKANPPKLKKSEIKEQTNA